MKKGFSKIKKKASNSQCDGTEDTKTKKSIKWESLEDKPNSEGKKGNLYIDSETIGTSSSGEKVIDVKKKKGIGCQSLKEKSGDHSILKSGRLKRS